MNCPYCKLGCIVGPMYLRYCDGCRIDITEDIYNLEVSLSKLEESVRKLRSVYDSWEAKL